MNAGNTHLSSNRIVAAVVVAAIADFLQLPLTAMSLSGALTVPTEIFDLCVDGVICIVLSILLGGFHWVLVPAFLAEAVPFLDVLPTWTAAVGLVVWMRTRGPREKQVSNGSAALTLTIPGAVRMSSSGEGEDDHG